MLYIELYFFIALLGLVPILLARFIEKYIFKKEVPYLNKIFILYILLHCSFWILNLIYLLGLVSEGLLDSMEIFIEKITK